MTEKERKALRALCGVEGGATIRAAYLEHGVLCASLSTGTERGSPCNCGYAEAIVREAGNT
jgi:hypothetical protein